MAFPPVFHDPVDTLRFGRALPVEITPPPPDGISRYESTLARTGHPGPRVPYSAPEGTLRTFLALIDRGIAVDAVVFGGPGDPLRHRGAGTILRRLRTAAHLETVVLTDGVLLGDRDARRDAGDAGLVVAWLPALEDPTETPTDLARRDAWERHVEGIAALRRETPTRIALELPVRPGFNDGPISLDGWKRAVARVRADRVFVMPAPDVDPARPDVPEALERIRTAVHRAAGAFLPDGTIVDRRGFAPA